MAFTEHVDFTEWGDGDTGLSATEVGDRRHLRPLDVDGYSADIE